MLALKVLLWVMVTFLSLGMLGILSICIYLAIDVIINGK